LAGSGESVVDVPPKLSARVRVLSTGNSRKNDGVDTLATALAASRNERLAAVELEADSEAIDCSPRGEGTWWPSVPGRSTASTRSCGTSCPAGRPERSRPTGQRASCEAYVPRAAPLLLALSSRFYPLLLSPLAFVGEYCEDSAPSLGLEVHKDLCLRSQKYTSPVDTSDVAG
jgi:hypothetical protein